MNVQDGDVALAQGEFDAIGELDEDIDVNGAGLFDVRCSMFDGAWIAA